MTGGRTSSPVLWVALVAIATGLAVYAWVRFRGNGEAPHEGPPVELTAAMRAELIAAKNIAIGHLENGEQSAEATEEEKGAARRSLDLAEAGFLELRKRLPGELLPLQNLVIGRLIALRGALPDESGARSAAEELVKFAPESAIAHLLAARVFLHLAAVRADPVERARGVNYLKQAVALAPDDIRIHYGMYDATYYGTDEEKSLAAEAIRQAYRLEPDNLAALRLWLKIQAEAQDPAIAETLARVPEVVATVRDSIRRDTNHDVEAFATRALAAVQAGDWNTARREVIQLGFLVAPQDYAKADLTRVEAHELEYVLYDFSDAFYGSGGPPAPGPLAPSGVTFAAWPLERQPATGAGARAVRIIDFDLDGTNDLVALAGDEVMVWTRNAAGDRWESKTRLAIGPGFDRILLADLDRDEQPLDGVPGGGIIEAADEPSGVTYADPDVVVYGPAGVAVLRNDAHAESGARTLVLVDQAPELAALKNVSAAALADIDHDGDLDLLAVADGKVSLFVAVRHKLPYFREVTEFSDLPAGVAATAVVPVDFDRDVDIDVIVASDGGAAGYLQNLRHGRFRWTPLAEDFSPLASSSSAVVLEADGNVSWDLAVATRDGITALLTATPRPSAVRWMRSNKVGTGPMAEVGAWDHDNDGRVDLWARAGNRIVLFRGDGAGGYLEGTDVATADAPVLACDHGDLDHDGDLDLVVATAETITVVENRGGHRHGWVNVYAMGRADEEGRANHHAIGSTVELKAGTTYQAQVASRPITHFGIGDADGAEVLRVLWTTGIPQAFLPVPKNVWLTETMDLKGSCPYVYTWNGERFEFLTDCLWAAPIGLQTADGTVAPCRPWEYLLVPGDRLRPRDGFYEIKLTEELWEAAYFDRVQLVAVDHPAGVDVYSNEKVGPPAISEFGIHTVRTPLPPVAARDQRGRDVLAEVRERDGVYFQGFDARVRQGLVEPHYLELDFGELAEPARITLFLTGWIRPTDTSLNVAFRQDPEIDGPQLPAVWVPGADGRWREAIGFMGFPGGKTKTIAVDLSGLFAVGDYRVRIATSAEIYWDEAFVTADEPEVEVRTVTLDPVSAALEYRGFSAKLPFEPRAPRRYDHDRVDRRPQWPPMQGRFTRYGDVWELVREPDDRMVVMGSGDAMLVRFPALPDPPEGWTRDFLLHTVGWDKDADLNTLYGQSTEPLPFRAMTSYPYAAGEQFPDSAMHREYFERYQTRVQSTARFWRQVKRGE